MPGTAFQDYIHSKFILIWGANPAHSNIHLVPYLKKAHLGGALIAVVDPRRIFSADMVDIFIQPRPGSDVAIALAMIRHLNRQGGVAYGFLREHSVGWEQLLEQAESFSLERAASISDVPAADIARLAETYAEISPAVVRCGWGLERNRNGLAAVAAVLALPAVIGKFGQVGGGYTLSNSGAFKVDDAKQAGLPESNTRLLNMCQLGQILDGDIDPPVKTLFIYNANPVAAVPDANRIVRGLMRSDLFTVVLDQVHTDTCAYADILLPATTFLEHTEVAKSYGSYTLHVSAPVVTPAGESKCNAEVFQMLGRAMGWKDGLFVEEPQSLLQRALSAIQMPFGTGLKLESLQPSATLNLEFSGGRPVQFVNVFPNTPDGKIHLYPAALGSQPYSFYENPAGDHFPLILISPATNKTINSTLGEYNLRQVYVGMHPQDAAQRNLKSGDVVQVHNDRGEIRVTLKIDARLRPGVVFLPKGFWQRATLNKAVSTALVPDHVTPISGGACFNDARVQVSKGSVIK
jgi:anaerobic selenocysteine-containing dehydrogenase